MNILAGRSKVGSCLRKEVIVKRQGMQVFCFLVFCEFCEVISRKSGLCKDEEFLIHRRNSENRSRKSQIFDIVYFIILDLISEDLRSGLGLCSNNEQIALENMVLNATSRFGQLDAGNKLGRAEVGSGIFDYQKAVILIERSVIL